MGQIFLKDKDGLTQGFTIKGDQPSPTEQARIDAILNGTPAPSAATKPEDNTGIMSAFAQGVGSGFNQMQAGMSGLAALAARDLSGNGKFAGYTPEEWEASQDEQQAEADTYYQPQGTLGEQDGLYGKTRYLAYQLGQSAPSTVGGVVGATLGTALGPAGTIGGFLAGAGGAGLGSLPVNYQQNIQEQKDTYGHVNSPEKAFLGAVGQSALEGIADRATLGAAHLIGSAVPDVAKGLIRGATKGAFTKAAARVGEATLMGMGTEGATEAVQQAIQRWQADKPLGNEEAQREYLENAIVGGLLGGVTGGAFGTVGATLEARNDAKLKQIQKDLDETDTVGDFRKENQKARASRAGAEIAEEDKVSHPLLEDMRLEQDLLSGPNAVKREEPLGGGPAKEASSSASPEQKPPTSLGFSTQEYSDAVAKMTGEKLVSSDKIKNSLKIGRTKADAIFNEMMRRGDGIKAGSNGQYLTVVDKSSSGDVETEGNTGKITRRYEVRKIAKDDVAPYNIRRASDTKHIGPNFKTAEEAFQFAEQTKNLGDYTVVENPTPHQYGVYEVTSGVPGQKPTSRFVRSFPDNQSALDHANGLNPALSPDANAAITKDAQQSRIAQRVKEAFGRYQPNVQSLLDKIAGPGRVAAEVAEWINGPEGHIIEGATDAQLVNGMRRIRLATDVFDANMSPDERQAAINSVAHHEAVHVVKAAGLFTPQQWKALSKRANARVAGKGYTYLERAQVRNKDMVRPANMTDQEHANLINEEAIAEMFRDYMRDPTAFTGEHRSLLRRMADFIRTLGQYARHVREGNDVLADLAEGKIGQQEARPDRAAMYGPYYSSVRIPGFYLKSAKYFEGIADHNPDQTYPGQQWLGMLKNAKGGIKEEELQWLGLPDWLKDQKKVSVRDILQYIAANSIDVHEGIADQNSGTYHREYTQKGGDDYKELYFHMPHLEPKFSQGGHFDGIQNILAFGRFKTRIIDGKKTLFIEEMQSDLHQQGRKKGYTSAHDMQALQENYAKSDAAHQEMADLHAAVQRRNRREDGELNEYNDEELAAYDVIEARLGQLLQEREDLQKKMNIPEAPFKTSWSDLVIKRLVRYAAENGHDAISWNAEPEGVALTEQYIREGGDYPQRLEESTDAEGNPEYNVIVRDRYDRSVIDGKNVTGIVNFYTKRLARDVVKLFGKQFGVSPQIVPKITNSGADFNLDEMFPDPIDFQMGLEQMYHNAAGAKEARAIRKAMQVAKNQRDFDPVLAINASGIKLDDFIDLYNETFQDMPVRVADPTMDEHGNPNVARWVMDITPELKSTALDEGFPLWSAVSKRTAPDTNEFRRWFAGSQVVGDDGKPLVLYHGALKDFDRFRHGNIDAAVGPGFYFTDTPDDASENYASPDGPDQIYKMQRDTDELLNSGDYEGEPDEEGILPEVRAQHQQHGGAVYPVYLSIKNPIVLNFTKSTRLNATDIQGMIDAAHELEGDYLNFDAEGVAQILKELLASGNTNAEYVSRQLQASGAMADAMDPDTGREAARGIISKLWEGAGYDGIIMKGVKKRWPLFENLTDDTTHYIAFQPEQVKSVNNTGSYNPDDARMMYSSVSRPLYSAAAPIGQRVPNAVPLDKVADFEAKITYNNIAPAIERLLRGVGKVGLSKERSRAIAEGTVFALQDVAQPLAKLIDRVRDNGGSISNETDTYLRHQLMTGRIEDQINKSKKAVIDPLVHAVQKLNVTKQDVEDLLARHPSNVIYVNGTPYEKAAVRSILQNYADPKLALAEVYLYAQHAKERNAEMRRRNVNLQGQRPEQFDSGSGMSDAEANDVLTWFGSKPFASEFSDLSNPHSIRSLYRALISRTNDVRVQSGLTPDFRNMLDENGDPVDPYQDYAPLRGYTDNNPDHVDELTKAFARAGKRLNIAGKEDRSATGRASEASNLIANAILQHDEAIVRAQKNEVAKTFLNMLKNNMGIRLDNGPNALPNQLSDFAEVVPLTVSKPVYDSKAGVVRMAPHPQQRDPDIMIVKDGGKQTGIRIKDARLRQALLGNTMLGDTGQRALINGLLKLNRILAAVRTSYNPEFLVSNFFRDFGAAQLNLSELQVKGLRTEVLRTTLPAIRGVYNSIRDTNGSNPWRAVFEDFSAHGGKTAYMGTRDLDTVIGRTLDELSTDPEGKVEKIKSKIAAVGRLIEAQNDAVENGIRVATYKALVDKLLSMSNKPNDPAEIERIKNRAAYHAKNLTVNFNMGGSQKPMLNALYLFFNASIQGSAALVNPLIRSKTVRRLWLATVAAGALQDIILSAISGVAPDGEKEYDKIPDYVLETNMIFLNPFSKSGYIKIPMPYLFNAAFNSGRAMMRGARGGYTPGQTINSVLGTAASSLNPWGGGGSFLNYVAPTVADPFVDLATNTNFMGTPISPEKDPYSATDLPAQRYWNNTSGFYTTMANLLDKASGGDGVFKGGISYSPNQYEYAFEFLGGGAWSTAVRAWGLVSPTDGNVAKALKGDEVSANDIPFVRRFVGNLTSREDMTRYIENRDRVMSVRTAMREALKDGDSQTYQEIIQKYPDEYRAAVKVNAFESRRRKISGQIKKINGNKRLSEADKKKLIEPLKKQQETLINQANLYMGA